METSRSLINLYVLQALAKGFTVFYFVLLPVFFANKIMNSAQLGYIGALFIAMLIVGAYVVAQWLHGMNTKKILQLTSLGAIGASLLLHFAAVRGDILLLAMSYSVMGLVNGVGMSGVNALAAQMTTRGKRFQALAMLGMTMDMVRITFPLIVLGAIKLGAFQAAVGVSLLAALLFLFFATTLKDTSSPEEDSLTEDVKSLRKNTTFFHVIGLEFLDSFSSSQLFVFLPLLFLAKGYSIENSLVLQSFVFLGYLSGRWLIGYLAEKHTGPKAIGFAEIGMAVCIGLLLILRPLWILYLFSYILGIFTRGTSPAIKALVFDSLEDHQIKKGSALHVVAGDSGSALGQLLFGIMIAWYGVNVPFVVAAGMALIVASVCLFKPTSLVQVDS